MLLTVFLSLFFLQHHPQWFGPPASIAKKMHYIKLGLVVHALSLSIWQEQVDL